jgi:DNA (cytosine-5)-methyltransferase 1
LGDEIPGPDFSWAPELGRDGLVRLTIEQTALLQGFPAEWLITGKKTARYRQVGHASPPPVGEALGRAVAEALRS